MGTPQVVAHRGASRAARENTLAAFDLASKLGADGIELDVRRTADGLMAVHHDAALADGRLICDTTAADLPDHVPLLADALDACGDLWVNIEIKNHPDDPDHDSREVLAAAVAHHLAQRGEDQRNAGDDHHAGEEESLLAIVDQFAKERHHDDGGGQVVEDGGKEEGQPAEDPQ